MFKNAIEKIKKFYELDLNRNSHADEMFDVLNEIMPFDKCAIFYLAPNTLSLQFGKNYEIYEDIKLSDKLSQKLYDITQEHISPDMKKLLKTNDDIIAERLLLKDAVVGIIIVFREKKLFTPDEKIIFKTCAQIISSIIKDIEITKVLKLQVQTMEDGLTKTHQAYETVKKQNTKIKQDEKLQNRFIANVSHELRTPLNSIIGFSETLGSKIFGDLTPKQEEYINDIRIAGLKLLEMINDILDITKIESGSLNLNLSEVNPSELLEEICNILKPLLDNKKINLVKEIQSNITLQADRIKLQQILFNIIGNAIKYSPTGGNIIIKINSNNKNVNISIKDEGCGIEKKYHSKIFNKFFQVPNSQTTQTSTGLGLTIAKEFVKLHKGKIKISSEPDKGCEFVITIPIK